MEQPVTIENEKRLTIFRATEINRSTPPHSTPIQTNTCQKNKNSINRFHISSGGRLLPTDRWPPNGSLENPKEF